MKVKQNDIAGLRQRGTLPPCILLYGQDQGMIQRESQLIRQQVLGEGTEEGFDHESFIAEALDEERFLTACRAFPFFSEKRLVTLKEIDKLPAGSRKTVIDYLGKPSPSTVLLILGGNLPVTHPVRKQCEQDKRHWAVAYFPLDPSNLRTWLRNHLARAGYEVEADALRFLAGRLDGDTLSAEAEMEKLMLFMGNARRIGLDECLAMVGETRVHSGFGLMEALFSGHVGQAMAILDRVLAAGDEPLQLLGLLISRLRRLIQARAMLAAGEEPQAVARKLNIFWKENDAFFAQCRQIREPQLAQGLLDCLEADSALKSDGETERVLGGLILRIAARHPQSEPGTR
ncbi:MAG: DNA polymerase III subunit delta [Magnetococcales bacterium]|nr:DNA polymerase III subunit delta [Magnetococcales bacterium]